MKKYGWCTDVHLNFVTPHKRSTFYDSLKGFDGIFLTGDISDATTLKSRLEDMYAITKSPIYFILGNHDYYHGKVAEVKRWASELGLEKGTDNNLMYLGDSPIFFDLGFDVYLLGIDGWADARAGDFMKSSIRLNDSNYIWDLKRAERLGGRKTLGREMQRLSDIDTFKLKNDLLRITETNKDAKEIIILTHVPPFEECSLYRNRPANWEFSPFFVNVGLGDMLLEVAKGFPNIKFTVLCGHTHHRADVYKLPNLHIRVGHAEYGLPQIEDIIEVGE